MRDIVMCGIPRSGSTLVWQILQEVFPNQRIHKTHPDLWETDGSIVVISIRDPRDVAASLLRVRLSRAGGGLDGITNDDVATVLRRTQLSFDRLNLILKGPHIPFLRYEEFYNDYSIIYKVIEEAFGIQVAECDQIRINERFSLKENKKRADKLENFSKVDKDEIHGDHIGHVVPGYWRRYFPRRYWSQVKNVYIKVGKKWGY